MLQTTATSTNANAARWWFAAVVLLAALPYLGKLGNGFLLWDDVRFIHHDAAVHSLANLPQFFSEGTDGLYRPLRRVLYAISYDAFGFAAKPLGYEIVGLLLHLLCSVAFFGIARRLTGRLTLAGMAGAIFATHPVHVERVAGITASYDLLGDGLLLLAIYLFLDDERASGAWRWATALLAALFASEMAAVFLPLLVAIDFVRGKNWRDWVRSRWWAYLLAFALTVGYAACRFAVLGNLGRGVARPAVGFVDNLLSVAISYGYYVWFFICPWNVNYFHAIPVAAAGARLSGIIALGGALALLVAALVGRRRWPALSIGILWFFICLLPFSQILPNNPAFQERYAYLPLGGFALALGAVGETLWRKAATFRRREMLIGGACAGLLLMMTITGSYVRDFRDDLSLWTRVLQRAPNHAGAANNVGTALMQRGRYAEALPYFDRAHALDPQFTLPLRNEARTFEALNRWPEALAALEQYLALAPQDRLAAAERERLRARLTPAASAQ